MKIIFDISVIFPTTTGDKLFLQKRKNLLHRYIDIKIKSSIPSL